MGSLLLAVIYLIFISLGLPDSLLGSGWPVMQTAFSVPSSYAGFVSLTISAMTIVSALLGPKMIRRFHTKWIVAVSVFLTVVGLLGFSFSGSYWLLFLFAIPYGLGAGAIDTSVNHYVAIHYSSRVMNFLHCFYGVGAVISPGIMGLALRYARWNEGYRWTAYLQIAILALVLLSLPLWQKNETKEREEARTRSIGIRESLKIPALVLTLFAFFFYCSGETTCALWASSYFAGTRPELSEDVVASFGALMFGGLMIGRLLSGFVSDRTGDRALIRIGTAIELFGILMTMIPFQSVVPAAAGFVLIGVGMGPVYPAVQHMAPAKFGQEAAAAAIGLQMASAYTGSTLMPVAFGQLQEASGIWILPLFLLILALFCLILLELSHRKKWWSKR